MSPLIASKLGAVLLAGLALVQTGFSASSDAGSNAAASEAPGTSAAPADPADSLPAFEETVRKIFQERRDCVVRVESSDELGKLSGTGFFADPNGLVYTLGAAVGDGRNVTVTKGAERWPAELLVRDERSGIALLKVEANTPFLPPAPAGALPVASPVLAVGFPLDMDASPSFGLVAGLDKKYRGRYFSTTHIRVNLPVQRGQGGSPVLNLRGEVVGILVSGLEDGSGGYVLPIQAAEKIRQDYSRFGEVRHGWAGATVRELAQPTEGSTVALDKVERNGPAASAGFQSGDVVLQVGQVPVHRAEDALDASFFLTAGEPVDVTVVREGRKITLPLLPEIHPAIRKTELQVQVPSVEPGAAVESWKLP